MSSIKPTLRSSYSMGKNKSISCNIWWLQIQTAKLLTAVRIFSKKVPIILWTWAQLLYFINNLHLDPYRPSNLQHLSSFLLGGRLLYLDIFRISVKRSSWQPHFRFAPETWKVFLLLSLRRMNSSWRKREALGLRERLLSPGGLD